MNKLFNLLYYSKCINCSSNALGICNKCLELIELNNESICPVCLCASPAGRVHTHCFSIFSPYNLFIPFLYGGVINTVFRELRFFYALKQIVFHAAALSKRVGYTYKSTIVMPLYNSDKQIATLNTTIAGSLSKCFDLETQPMIEKNNLEKNFITNSNILLVASSMDYYNDLLNEAKLLYQNGAQMINCFVLTKKIL